MQGCSGWEEAGWLWLPFVSKHLQHVVDGSLQSRYPGGNEDEAGGS